MASANDMTAANETYNGFIKVMKWGGGAVALITLFVVLLIA